MTRSQFLRASAIDCIFTQLRIRTRGGSHKRFMAIVNHIKNKG